ncbi:MAG: helix-turn-helix transcriptional regulator [Treponema sp.]|jgi:predicted transcriptional regulator|nr:helix-turn-helix transcriptional regulator [Treponema sp.]MBQ4235334.1 helix-turn-helix transcriptional regulator [Treponema sp.]
MDDEFDRFKAELLRNPKIKAEYDALDPEYELIGQLIKARIDENMTQKQLAEKIGTKQSCIARLESGNYNPSFQFLQKVAGALNKRLTISLV